MRRRNMGQSEENLNVVDPALKQLSQIGWFLMGRYLLFILAVGGFLHLMSLAGVGIFMTLENFFTSFDNTALHAGFQAAVRLYPGEFVVLTLARFFLGFGVTYWIFKTLVKAEYPDFSLKMRTSVSDQNSSAFQKEVLHLAWAFYWRYVGLVFVFFMALESVIKPEWMVDHLFWFVGFNVFSAFMLLLVALKLILNKPIGQGGLLVLKK